MLRRCGDRTMPRVCIPHADALRYAEGASVVWNGNEVKLPQ
jgi:hypothetical protein